LIHQLVTGQWNKIKELPDFQRLIWAALKADNHLSSVLGYDDLADELLIKLCSPHILTEEQYTLFKESGGNVDFPLPSICGIHDPANFWGYINTTIIHTFIVSYVKDDPTKLTVPPFIKESVGVENGFGRQNLDEEREDKPPLIETIPDESGNGQTEKEQLSAYLTILELMERRGYTKFAEVLRRTEEMLHPQEIDRLAIARDLIEKGLIRPRKKGDISLGSLYTLEFRAKKVFNDFALKEGFDHVYILKKIRKKAAKQDNH